MIRLLLKSCYRLGMQSPFGILAGRAAWPARLRQGYRPSRMEPPLTLTRITEVMLV